MIDKKSPVPLYVQLVNILTKQIHTELRPNEKMLSEREICQKYHVSRTTVRIAMRELEAMGYVYRRHGKGTYVGTLNREKQNLMNNYSFTNQVQEMGKTPTTKILGFELQRPTAYVADKMEISPNQEIFTLRRLRLIDNVPMMTETSYIPCHLFPTLTKKRILEKSLYAIFQEDFDQPIKHVEEEISANIINTEEARALRIDVGAAGLRIKRISRNTQNNVVEFTLSTARSDQFVYKISHNI